MCGVLVGKRSRSKKMERNLLLGEWLALHELGDLVVEIVRELGEHGIGAHRGGGGGGERRISGAVAVSEERRKGRSKLERERVK